MGDQKSEDRALHHRERDPGQGQEAELGIAADRAGPPTTPPSGPPAVSAASGAPSPPRPSWNGVSRPEATPPSGTAACLIENTSGVCRDVLTRARMTLEAGALGA